MAIEPAFAGLENRKDFLLITVRAINDSIATQPFSRGKDGMVAKEAGVQT